MKFNNNIKQLLIYAILFIILGGLVFTYIKYTETETDRELVFCDFEKIKVINNKIIYSTNTVFYNVSGTEHSNEKSFSGEFSMLVNKTEFVNLASINHVKSEAVYKISILRNGGSARLVVQEESEKPDLYHSAMFVLDTLRDDWGKLVVQFRVPPNYSGNKIKIYIWNPAKEASYFDDFRVEQLESMELPEYPDVPNLHIYIENIELQKLLKIKREAFKKGILISNNDSYVNALVAYEGKMMEAQLRFKGDWLDHLAGDKWSFRIKLTDDSWNGMCTFSIHTPFSRSFASEWFIHEILEDNDILTTKYGFIPVVLNNRSLGIYAYEEHFDKQLVERNKRREGPIIAFSEEDLWDRRSFTLTSDESYIFRSSYVKPFKEGKILKNKDKLDTFILAQNLLDSYKNGELKASQVFDIEKFAKYYAILTSLGGYHGLVWHNIRFYYNPVTCFLEPIGYDCFSNYGIYTWGLPEIACDFKIDYNKKYIQAASFYIDFLTDTNFVHVYKQELVKYSDINSTYNYLESNKLAISKYEALISREFLNYSFDKTEFIEHTTKINKQLNPFIYKISKPSYNDSILALSTIIHNTPNTNSNPTFVNNFIKTYKNSATQVSIRNYNNHSLEIIGFGTKNKIAISASYTIENLLNDAFSTINITKDESEYKYIYYKTALYDSIYSQRILPWPAPTNYSPRIDITQNNTDISQYFYSATKTYVFKGDLQFNNHIYIPSGYTVVFEAGANVDFVNNAAFISNSTVLINGTKNNPVNIYSSDKTANGFTVLQAAEKSKINYAIFKDFNTLNYNGWVLTGAVNFYESDVEITNTLFTDNHCEDMLNTIRCEFLIKDCTLKNTFGDSHDSDFCTGTLSNCDFINNGNDAIDFSTSEATIIDCSIIGAVDKGISVGENTQVIIKNIKIENVNIGIASKDLSHAEIDNCVITGATYGFVLLQKKPEFGPATISANNCKLKDVWTESLIEQKSRLSLNGKIYKGNKAKLKALFYE